MDSILVCSYCHNECEGKGVDLSFSHAFGTEVDGFYGSRCCEAQVYWIAEDDYSTLQQLKEDASYETLDEFLEKHGRLEDGSDMWSE